MDAVGSYDVVAASKALYADSLPADLLEDVETWDDYHQDFFWSYVWIRYRQEHDRAVLRAIEECAEKVGRDYRESPTPFMDAEESISAHSWFRPRIQRH